MQRPPALPASRFGVALVVGALSGVPGMAAAMRAPADVAATAAGLVPLAFAGPVLATWCHPDESVRDQADLGFLLLGLQILAVTLAAGSSAAIAVLVLASVPWLFLLPDQRRGRPSPRPALVERLRLAPAFGAFALTAFLPAAKSDAGGLLVATQAMTVAIVLFCALSAPAALAEWREGFGRSGWATALLTLAGVIAFGPILLLRKRGSDWLDDVFDGKVAWSESLGCWTWILAGAVATLALTVALIAAVREHGFAALNEEFQVLSTVATATLVAGGVAPAACIPLAIQVAVFVRWTVSGLAWATILLHLAPAVAIGYAAAFARFLSAWPAAWIAYGLLLGAAFGVAAVNVAVLRTLARVSLAGGRWQAAYGLWVTVASATADRDDAVRAGDCAARLSLPAASAQWYERAGLWARAGSLYLKAAHARRRPVPRSGA